MKLIKGIIPVLVIAFAVFYLLARPQDAANVVQGAIAAVVGAGAAVTEFFVALSNG